MAEYRSQDKDMIFALDIGTRSIVGVVGKPVGDRFKVLDVELAEHGRRYMLDGQIDNIEQVAALARTVTARLEERLGVRLQRVSVAAAGRALRTQRGSFELELENEQAIDAEFIARLEAGAVTVAEEALQLEEDSHQRFFLVGYTVSQYRLDNYPLAALQYHTGKKAEADVVATFLPGEVVESLYAAMRTAGLQVSSMTLEPIAAMNAAIPADIRLLNLALVDIGAGTTDIAICKEGSVVGYTMVTVAGDEITETLMRAFLVDFQTAEQIKRELREEGEISYVNILGLEETVSWAEVAAAIKDPTVRLADAIAKQVVSVNGGPPSALYLSGGGSKLVGLKGRVAQSLEMDARRVAVAGSNFSKSVFSDNLDLDNPEYTTPLGIAISAGMGLLNDSYVVMLNGEPAKLFRNGILTLRDVLQMNGYTYADMMGRTGQSLTVTLDGKRIVVRGEPAVPAVLTLNGKEVSIAEVVHAGDHITFIPARHGADAGRTLGELLGSDFEGEALVNNRPASLDTPLGQGDVVLRLRNAQPAWKREESAASSISRPAPQAEPVRSAPPSQPAPQAERTWSVPSSQITSQAEPVRSAPPSQPAPQSERTWSVPFSQPAPVPTQSAPVSAPPAPKRRETHIRLNDMPFVLEGKEDGQPHYLMDLLQYSGIDFDRVDRPVRLEVNGVPCSFRYEIKENDSVVIACD